VDPDRRLGWNERLHAAWVALGSPGVPGRVSRIDRGWSSVMATADDRTPARVRNLYADVAIGDWVVASDDGERIDHVIERTDMGTLLTERTTFTGPLAWIAAGVLGGRLRKTFEATTAHCGHLAEKRGSAQ